MTLKIADQEFIDLWKKSPSPAAVARITGLDMRNIFRRRDSLEKKYGILLESEISPNKTDAYVPHAPREVQERIENGTVIVFSDAHYAPGNATPAHKALVRLVKELSPKIVIANGDMFDGASSGLNRHPPIGWAKTPSVMEEIDAVTTRLYEIEEVAKKAKLHFTLGNHDIRFDRYIAMSAPELAGMPGTRLMDYFKAWTHSWSVRINDTTIVKHRWHNGIHATYNNILKSGLTCMVTGHLHRLLVTGWGDYTGRKWGVDTGTLADPHGGQFEYVENNPTPWCSGFAVLTYHKGELLTPEVCEVLNGVAYFRGKPL